MNTYKRHRFPPDIISYAVWLYFRFNLSHRDIEDLLAQRELIPNTIHNTAHMPITGCQEGEVIDVFLQSRRDGAAAKELSHQPTRVRERGMRRFKSTAQAQRFLNVHAAVYNLFNLGRHLVRAEHYKKLRIDAFGQWTKAVA